MWLYPDGTDPRALDEVPPAEMFQVAAEARAYLGEAGIDLAGQQQTKTKTALEFFAKEREGADHTSYSSSAMNSSEVIGWENIGKSYLSALSCSSVEVAATQSLSVMTW